MAQLAVLRVHADRSGRRGVAWHPTCHLEIHESRAYQLLHGLHGRTVGAPDRLLALADLEAVRETLGTLLLELPQREIGGQLPEWEELEAQIGWARERGLQTHLDGARLWEAQTFYERPLADIAGLFDSVYVSFYKGLGGIAGCCVAGEEDVIGEARVWQARHGGRLIELYPYTLAAEWGLDERLPRMPRYTAHARAVAAALRELSGVRIVPDPPQVNMMHLLLEAPAEALERAALEVARERRIWTLGRLSPTLDPRTSRCELTIGDASLEISPPEAAALVGEVLDRARG
jgi:threonine aldolase